MTVEDAISQATGQFHMNGVERASSSALATSEDQLLALNQKEPADIHSSYEAPQTLAKPVNFSVVGNKKLWDITDDFRKKAAALGTGILVKDEQFTLFESVGALEIMDPKMDSGFLQPGETLEDHYDVLRDLLPEEVVGIIDQLLCYEMAWHQGYPLSQTLFISHYIDKLLWPEPKGVANAQFFRGVPPDLRPPSVHLVLRSYCVALVKCCGFVMHRIGRSQYYEEEDFSTHTYNRDLGDKWSREVILRDLDTAMVHLEEGKVWDTTSMHEKLIPALLSRLRFRRDLVTAMDVDTSLERVQRNWANVDDDLQTTQETFPLGKPVEEAFSMKIQRRLTSTVPPRPIIALRFDEAFNLMAKLCSDCKEAVRMLEVGTESVERLKAFLWAFNGRQPEPLPYAKACVSALLFDFGQETFDHFFRRDLSELIFPNDMALDPINWTFEAPRNPRVKPDPRYELACTIDLFMRKAMQDIGGYVDFFRALCSNRCRLRRTLCHVLIAMDDIQREAEGIDPDIRTLSADMSDYPLATWSYHQKLRVMEWIVQLGFELDVYLPDELAGMYWWLAEITSTRAALLEHLRPFLRRRHAALLQRNTDAVETEQTMLFVDSLISNAKGTHHLAQALTSLYIQLSYLKLLPTPKHPYNDPFLRYELRMRPFLTISPPTLPSFERYTQTTQPLGPYTTPTQDIFAAGMRFCNSVDLHVKHAKEHFAQVKKLGAKAAKADVVEESWKKEVSGVLASCIATGVAGSVLRNVCNGQIAEGVKMDIPEMGRRYHGWWVVPKIVLDKEKR